MTEFRVDFRDDVLPDGSITLHDTRLFSKGHRPLAIGDVVHLSDEVGNNVNGSVRRVSPDGNIVNVELDHDTWKDAIFA